MSAATNHDSTHSTWATKLAQGVSEDVLKVLRLDLYRLSIKRFTPAESPIWDEDARERLGRCPDCQRTFLTELERRIQEVETCPSTMSLIEHLMTMDNQGLSVLSGHIEGCNICRGLCELVERNH